MEDFRDFKILLIPHIFRDYNVIYDILNEVEDTFRRERIDVAGLRQGSNGMHEIINCYNKCSIVLANRFHSNVIGLVLKKPVFGLFNYRQIKDLYREINLDNYHDIRCNEGLDNLFNAIQETLSNDPKNFKFLSQDYLIKNKEVTLNFFKKLWIKN